MTDSLLHGLRLVLGDRMVDVPRRDALYDDLSVERKAGLYGRGFTLYGRLPEVDVNRESWRERALEGEFDVIVFPDIWRHWGPWVQMRSHLRTLRLQGVKLVAVDGSDGTPLFPHGPRWWRRMRPWPLPRIYGRIEVFKREMAPATASMRCYGLVPPNIAERVVLRRVRSLAFSIPEDRLATGNEPKSKLLTTHVVDPEIVSLLPDDTRLHYAFDSEEEYYADLRASRFGITTKKAGWETLRHYEIAASGCVPCFRNLQDKPPRTAPFGLNETNSVPYSDPIDLLQRVSAMPDAEYNSLRSAALQWAQRNTTRARAREFLSELGAPQPPSMS